MGGQVGHGGRHRRADRGALAGVASAAGQRGRMILLGAVVGLAAAAVFPILRGAIGA